MASHEYPTAAPAPALVERYGRLDGEALLRPMIEREFAGRIALVSSFGTEAAVLLRLVAEIDPATPILFIDTGKLFGETLRYRNTLVTTLGLRDVRTVRADAAELNAADPNGELWQGDSEACCRLRKIEPLAAALGPFDAWITGRKRYHGAERTALPPIEALDGRIKINPLAGWSAARIRAAFAEYGLPPHPLVADGFRSVGCQPCTSRIAPGAEPRSGRWAGTGKSECGIHLALARKAS
jgi:phosphoadenosine phosphosulfate reductase